MDYRTHDMYLAAYLAARGVRWKSKSLEGRQVMFTFPVSQELKDSVYAWEFGDASVNAKLYRDWLREIKGQIYIVLDNPQQKSL